MKNVCGLIYKVTNKINNKVYIGQTVCSLRERKRCHFKAVKNTNTSIYFHNAINKYGHKNFNWEILEYCNSKYELNLAEEWYIRIFNSIDKKNGYNLTYGGEGSFGYKHSKEIKKKMSLASFNSENHVNRGKHLSNIWKEKIRIANTGKRWTKEQRINFRKSRKGKLVGKNSPCSKKFVITKPNGDKFYIQGLKYFSEKYEDGLLDFRLLSACANGKRRYHKNYKCRYFDAKLDANIKFLNI